ncbi:RDD family protein [Campylobacter ureolyticus]|uniref:RDD family protein n=1 Tax=Campylobacter ureolyticus TaxID=827 RepID=UPI00215B0781|nr:RDD family protein [Campylobacter ureolyticus]MCR8699598.1 RDD family protein [Campylobacter ureolyticus]
MAKQKAVIAPISLRIKAFIIDIFIISMPLLYFTTYVVLGSKESFQNNQIAILIVWLIYGIITSLFFSKKAQTPGYKSQEIYLIDIGTGKKISFLKAFLRYLIFLFGATFLFGILMCFFRKDRLNLHDILTNSTPAKKKE